MKPSACLAASDHNANPQVRVLWICWTRKTEAHMLGEFWRGGS